MCKEEEISFPFGAQAAATSARVPRTGIVVPLRRKRTGCGRCVFTVGRCSFLWQRLSDVQASGGAHVARARQVLSADEGRGQVPLLSGEGNQMPLFCLQLGASMFPPRSF